MNDDNRMIECFQKLGANEDGVIKWLSGWHFVLFKQFDRSRTSRCDNIPVMGREVHHQIVGCWDEKCQVAEKVTEMSKCER